MNKKPTRKIIQKQQMDWVDSHPVIDKDGVNPTSKPLISNKENKNRKKFVTKEMDVDMEMDLHGCTVEEAMYQVEEMLKAMKTSGHVSLRVIHGLSSGLTTTIQQQLKRNLRTVWKPHNLRYRTEKHNPGATIIYLDANK